MRSTRSGPRIASRRGWSRSGPSRAALSREISALVGGGDPLLDTDALGDMIAEARAAGLRSVSGRFLTAAGALPALDEIAPDQPVEAGYNPAVSGLNLNFNRAQLAWAPGADGPALTVSAPGARFDAPAPGIVARIGAAPLRVALEDGREVWTLPAARLPGRGSIWLPVRRPPDYAGGAFRGLAAQAGLVLPAPEAVEAAPEGAVFARRASPPLEPMMRDLLRYSTNLTAEVAGLTASRATGAPASSLATSAGAMTHWARTRYGLHRSAFVNHSGLSAESVMTPVEMVRLLVAAGARDGLETLLRDRPLRDGSGDVMEIEGVRVVAKTGTMDFISALAGFVEVPGGRRRAFAIFAADPDARARIPPDQRSDPPGAASWARRARAQEMALLRRWIAQDPGDALARVAPRGRPVVVAE